MTPTLFLFCLSLVSAGLAAHFYSLYDQACDDLKAALDGPVVERARSEEYERTKLREEQLARGLRELADADLAVAKLTLKIVYDE